MIVFLLSSPVRWLLWSAALVAACFAGFVSQAGAAVSVLDEPGRLAVPGSGLQMVVSSGSSTPAATCVYGALPPSPCVGSPVLGVALPAGVAGYPLTNSTGRPAMLVACATSAVPSRPDQCSMVTVTYGDGPVAFWHAAGATWYVSAGKRAPLWFYWFPQQ